MAAVATPTVTTPAPLALPAPLPPVVDRFRAAAATLGLAFVPRGLSGTRWAVYDDTRPAGDRDELWLAWVPGRRLHRGTVIATRYGARVTRRHRGRAVRVPLSFALDTVLTRLADAA